jgi:hypothetical protein
MAPDGASYLQSNFVAELISVRVDIDFNLSHRPEDDEASLRCYVNLKNAIHGEAQMFQAHKSR